MPEGDARLPTRTAGSLLSGWRPPSDCLERSWFIGCLLMLKVEAYWTKVQLSGPWSFVNIYLSILIGGRKIQIPPWIRLRIVKRPLDEGRTVRPIARPGLEGPGRPRGGLASVTGR
jgi:hypothetical protein